MRTIETDFFRPGDVVYLRSGSIKLTVGASVTGSSLVTVYWMVYGSGELRFTDVPATILIKALP